MTGADSFFDQFLEDYFAEAEEHLATARRVLLQLERENEGVPGDSRGMRDLLRSLHTLKGLAGMVGDASAERLAHSLEEGLRVAAGGGELDATLLDALFAGVASLEQCTRARRTGAEPPSVDAVLARLDRAAPEATALASVAPAEPGRRPAAGGGSTAAAPGSAAPPQIQRFEFTPATEFTARGIGVDAIRARLQTIGEIVEARPRMNNGSLVFDFAVALAPTGAPDEAWRADGMRWESPAGSAGAGRSGRAADGDAIAAPVGVAAAGASGSGVARVELARLDTVMRLVGDLVVTRARLDELLRMSGAGELEAARDALEATNDAMERQLRQLRESVTRIRLVPIGEVFERLRFAVRDAIRESGKEIELTFSGHATEIDKVVVDRMLEPLLHLVRNAVTHGVERPEVRTARGKPAEGSLSLRASAAGDRILIEVEDDGAGVDIQRVAARAREVGLLAGNEPLGADRLLDVLCAPGLSTRDAADRTSGRGVGMDIVRTTIRALAGDITLESTPGRGTRFAIELPLTLMIVDALLVGVGGQQMAVPQPTLREILQVESGMIVTFENNDVVPYRGGVLPIVMLSRLFGLDTEHRAPSHLLVVGSDAAPMALGVDQLHGLREIVVQPVSDPLVDVEGVSGATALGDGRVSLILDVAAILRLAESQRESQPEVQRATPRARAAGARRRA